MNEKGFTLPEVLVGILILTVGLLGVAGMQITSVKGNSISRNLSQATYIAKDRMEFMKNLPLDSAELNQGDRKDVSTIVSGVTYDGSVSIADNGDLKTINYRISWNDGVDHRISFSTIRYR